MKEHEDAVDNDIVTRLRVWPLGEVEPLDFLRLGSNHLLFLGDAAAEIERLRELGDALVSVMRSGSDSGWDDAIDAWREARRD